MEEKSAAPLAAMNKTLALLEDLFEQTNRMEVSQKEQVGKKQNGSPESIFGSARGVGAGINFDALISYQDVPERVVSDIL